MGFFRGKVFVLILTLSLSCLSACGEKQKVASLESSVANESVANKSVSDGIPEKSVTNHEKEQGIQRVSFLSTSGREKASVEVETVSTPEKLQLGLMFRKSLPEDGGMLFLMPRRKILSFWMKNTYLPLSIAYIDDGMRIVDIHKMRPLDEKTHYVSSSPCRYALEVNQGWFKAHGIRKRDKVSFLRN